jgi:uncharacterized protein involved in copper resistance
MKTADTWTVKPFYTPQQDSDPLGVFEIKEIKAQTAKWEDAAMDAAPGSDEEQHAIDRRDEVTEQAARLIAAAPAMLEALHGLKKCAAVTAERLDIDSSAAIWAWISEAQDALMQATGGRDQ